MKLGGRLSRHAGLDRKARLRTRSVKKSRRDREYTRLRKSFLSLHPFCQIGWDWDCTGWATEVHHARGRVGADLADVSRFVAACRHCHRLATEHPAEAYARGVSERRIA